MNKSNNEKSVCAVTGSFDPITLAHKKIIDTALENYDEVYVLILVNETKTYAFSQEDRVNFIKELYDNEDRVKVIASNKMAYQLLNELGIEIVLRGFRTSKDLEYEKEMANYNYEHGNIETILMKLSDKFIEVSSTKAKELLNNNESLLSIIPRKIIKEIREKYKEER